MTLRATFQESAQIWVEEDVLSDVVDQTTRMMSNLDKASQRVAESLHRHVQDEAVRTLPSRLSQLYLQGLLPPMKQGEKYVIGFQDDHAANSIERGTPPFDMRRTLLDASSPNVRISEDGERYRAIPFQWSVPGSKSHSGKNRLSKHPKDMFKGQWKPNIIRRDASGRRISSTKQRPRLPGSISPGYSSVKAPTTPGGKPQVVSPKSMMGYRRKTLLDKGLQEVRERNRKGQIMGTSFMTFRTISTATSDGWFHPGIKKYDLISKTYDKYRNDLERIAKEALEEGL